MIDILSRPTPMRSVPARLRDDGKAKIGAHLHPGDAPHVEEVSTAIPTIATPARARADQDRDAARAIEHSFGARPTVFKAGRYGYGPSTGKALADLGYEVDCSFVPHTDLSADGGPDFRGVPDTPHWLPEGLLEVPLTVGFLGAVPALGEKAGWVFDSRNAGRLHIPGALARTGLVARSRLTPEGTPAEEQCRLIEAMVARGHRTFSLTYHSPSLQPGNTPYVKDSRPRRVLARSAVLTSSATKSAAASYLRRSTAAKHSARGRVPHSAGGSGAADCRERSPRSLP